MSVYGTIRSNVISTRGSFKKSNFMVPAFTNTDVFTAETAVDLFLEVNNEAVTIDSGTPITMPGSPVTGTDYAVWAKPDGTLEATTNHVTPPAVNSRRIGGFHYAPGSNATAQAGGNDTPQINVYSFWDLAYRPACSDPRGMTLVADKFWCDIYLTGVDAITNGSSRYNVTIADGSSPPKIPTMFGGSGSSTYGSYTWFEAQELAQAFGKRSLTYAEFEVAAYGTTETTASGGTDVPTTGINGTGSTSNWNVFTSKWGLIQATGCMWIWGRTRGGPYAAASWNANTEGRGSEYQAPNASLFGGYWNNGTASGSRCSAWGFAASVSNPGVGSRFACDHLMLVT